jgi:hypothetical protein
MSTNLDQLTIDLSGIDTSPLELSTGTFNNLTVGTGAISGSGRMYQSNGVSPTWNSISAAGGPFTISPANTINSTIVPNANLELKGENADIIVNGVSLMTTLLDIQTRLNMLRPNPEIEQEWDELRELGEKYRALEKDIKEKINIWEKLKAMPPPKLD